MVTWVFCNGLKHFNPSVLIGFVEIIATEKLPAKFDLFLLNTKEVLGWGGQSKTAPSRKMVKMREAKMRERKKGNDFSILATTDSPHLQKAGTEQIRQILRASTAVHA